MTPEYQLTDRERETAATLRRQGFTGPADPCPYPAHREHDWQPLAGGPLVCGICHPPADDRLVAP